jgi:hypothetical protein
MNGKIYKQASLKKEKCLQTYWMIQVAKRKLKIKLIFALIKKIRL